MENQTEIIETILALYQQLDKYHKHNLEMKLRTYNLGEIKNANNRRK